MRYLLRKGQRSELSLRCQYLYEVFALWFVKTSEIGCFEVLESFPFGNDDMMIIYGHNYEIVYFFEEYKKDIVEHNIAIISCESYKVRGYRLKGKKIFLAPQRNGQSKLLVGKEYGFDFDITDAELHLYNCKLKEILKKIEAVFTRIQ